VRHPKPEIYTCLGGGYIASGSTDANKQPVPYLPDGAKLTDLEGAGEVQTPILYQGQEKLTHGDPIFLRHSKAGELCERFNDLYLISNGHIVDQVPTYRGEGKNFL
jgi:D-serine deaminase-like pyridoxal phosphate-dependent protein